MTIYDCMRWAHCSNPASHDYMNAMYRTSGYGSLNGGLGGYGYAAAQQQALSAIASSMNVVIPPSVEAKSRRCIEKLREEITDWHGSILKS